MSTKKKKRCPPVHQWTYGGTEVLILRCGNKDGSSHSGFKWPLTVGSAVEAPDWRLDDKCGGGLHGWPWGLSIGTGKEQDYAGTWIVFGADTKDVVEVEGDGKVKARRGTIRFVGSWDQALSFILAGQMAWVFKRSSGAASSTGESGAASSTGSSGAASSTGYRGAASSTGYRGAASSTGESGAASSTGSSGAASSTGESGAASSTGYRGAASSTGESGAASSTGSSGAAQATGLYSKACGGKYGCIALAWLNKSADRIEMQCAKIGCGDGSDGLLKANIWYVLNEAGEFVEEE